QPLRHVRDARRMAERVAYSDLALAVLSKFRPIIADAVLAAQFAALGQQMHQRRRDAFGRGEDRKECVAVNRSLRVAVGDSGPGIDDQLAEMVGGELDSRLAARGDEVIEQRLYAELGRGHSSQLYITEAVRAVQAILPLQRTIFFDYACASVMRRKMMK